MIERIAVAAIVLQACAPGLFSTGQDDYKKLVAEIEEDRKREDATSKCHEVCRGPGRWGCPDDRSVRQMVREAKKSREAEEPIPDVTGSVPNSPGVLYERWKWFADALPKILQAGCRYEQQVDFAQEWEHIERREQLRADALQELRERNAERVAEQERIAQQEAFEFKTVRDEREDELKALAKKHGYNDIVLGESLTRVLSLIVERAGDLTKAKRVAIELGEEQDSDFIAAQVLANGQARFVRTDPDAQFILRRHKGAIYEGTPVTSLKIEAVRIAGVTTYATAIGGTAQAFVIEPAW